MLIASCREKIKFTNKINQITKYHKKNTCVSKQCKLQGKMYNKSRALLKGYIYAEGIECQCF